MKLSEELESRGFIHQFVGDSLSTIVDDEKRVVYHGIDPSADSAHVGNFVAWVLLRHLALAGHKIVFLVGGGTGMLGDPKPDAERELKPVEDIQSNVEGLRAQAQSFFKDVPGEVEFVNNSEWLGELKFVDFLRDIGKHFTVNELVKKDAIARRLESDVGLSYTEFAYPIMQGYDYLQLYRTKKCTLQIGGSDQWGNIVSGVDLIRRKEQAEVFALTIPLIVDKSSGKKFGKSEGNAIWLDPEKTTPYQFYQFWFNTSDENVIDYLKLFTFLPLEDISVVERDGLVNPSARVAQKVLAREITSLVHGEEQSDNAEHVTNVLFGDGELGDLSEEAKSILIKNAPTYEVESGANIVDVLVGSELATSKREARMFVDSRAVALGEEKITDTEYCIDDNIFTGGIALLRRGKKQMTVLVSK